MICEQEEQKFKIREYQSVVLTDVEEIRKVDN